jgi:hypothetical protein
VPPAALPAATAAHCMCVLTPPAATASPAAWRPSTPAALAPESLGHLAGAAARAAHRRALPAGRRGQQGRCRAGAHQHGGAGERMCSAAQPAGPRPVRAGVGACTAVLPVVDLVGPVCRLGLLDGGLMLGVECLPTQLLLACLRRSGPSRQSTPPLQMGTAAMRSRPQAKQRGLQRGRLQAAALAPATSQQQQHRPVPTRRAPQRLRPPSSSSSSSRTPARLPQCRWQRSS